MSIILTGPTTAATSSQLTAATYTFGDDLALDGRSRVAVVTALGGTQVGVTVHTVDAPKQIVFKKPAQFLQPSGFNVTSGRYSKVPKNVHRVIGKFSAQVAAGQTEIIPMELSIGIPAGAMAFDRKNVEASIIAFVKGIDNQLTNLLVAYYDGRY
jgi:hypothetical protein